VQGWLAVPTQVAPIPGQPQASELQKAYLIVKYAHETAESLLDGFNGLRRGPGNPTDEQQDLLRAMLLFASAGLDACAKRVITEALPRLARNDDASRTALTKFTARRLNKGEEGEPTSPNMAFLAEVLVGVPEDNLIGSYVRELTGPSLQSVEGLSRVADALGVADVRTLRNAISVLNESFKLRNKIAHEMDINLDAARRNRNQRRREDMVAHTNRILSAADELMTAVDAALARCP
jgi:hypothetical protein